MNYYKRHLGDYAKNAGHLSMIEHGAYTLILDNYYAREQGPTLLEATRWARARTEDEKSAVLAVLDEFFTLGADERYTQKRVEEELGTYRTQAEVNRGIALERERRKRERRDDDSSTNRAQSVPDSSEDREPSHKPLAISHKPIEKTEGACAPCAVDLLGDEEGPDVAAKEPKAPRFDAKAALLAEGVELQQAADFLQIRKAKKAPLTLTALDGIKREAEKAGTDLAGAVAVCCVRGWQSFRAEWVQPDQRAAPRQPAKPSAYQVAHLDHSSTDQAMRDSMERHGIAMPEVGEQIEF